MFIDFVRKVNNKMFDSNKGIKREKFNSWPIFKR